MGRPKKVKAPEAEQVEDEAVEVAAPAPGPRQWKVGDRVTIKAGRHPAIITSAPIVEGRKQTRIECERLSDNSVNSYWFDEVE